MSEPLDAEVIENKEPIIRPLPEVLGSMDTTEAPMDYLYGAPDRFFVVALPARRHPLDSSVFIHYPSSTTVAPPEEKPNTRYRWNDETGEWEAVADYTKTKFYKKSGGACVMLGLGEEPDETMTVMPPSHNGCEWSDEDNAWRRPLEHQIAERHLHILAVSDAKTKKLETGCSQGEVGTWQRQESGARALMEDPEASSPDAEFVKALASARGITVEEQVAKIMAKVTFAVAYGAYVIGTQQKLEDQLKTATTQQDLDAVIWPEDPEEYATVIASL